MENKNFKPGKKASFVMKKSYNNNNMANLIKQHPRTFEEGDQYVEMVRLYEVKNVVPPEGGKGNPKDPYVKWSELKAELKALEDRIEDKFDKKLERLEHKFDKKFDEVNAKFDEVNAKFDEVNAKFDEVNNKINLINSTLELIVKKLDIK